MSNSTTIQIDINTWKALNSRKKPGDSFNDIIQRILEKTEANRDDDRVRSANSMAIAELIWEWEPGRGPEEREERRKVGYESLKWLSHQGEATRSDFYDELYESHNPANVSEKSWWRRSVRPLLNLGRERGIVDFQEGSKIWRWTDNQSPCVGHGNSDNR